MRVLVCGGRYFDDAALVKKTLDRLHADDPITDLIQGGATGADYLAIQWCKSQVAPIFRWQVDPPWHSHLGGAAGPMRNLRMLKWLKPDLVVAFPGGRGTGDMVMKARANKVKVLEVWTL